MLGACESATEKGRADLGADQVDARHRHSGRDEKSKA